MPLTLNQAAKTCGRSKSTLLNAINSGRMSAPKDDRGRYAIDPAELHRAFSFQAPDRSADRFPEPQPTTHENHQTTLTDQGLKREVELLREMLGKAEANADHGAHWPSVSRRSWKTSGPRNRAASFSASSADKLAWRCLGLGCSSPRPPARIRAGCRAGGG
uniref:Helix-turn-helix domain-containing protein n=1 Tax=Paracoccus yeei TaxID=147645 RepID=A0A0D5A1M5_9RHOB|nr:hypothetical protein pLM20P2_p2 [Paracoccus yeei]